MQIDRLLATYPRHRVPLTKAYREIYEEEYKLNRVGGTFFSSLSKKAEGWMHRRVAWFGGPGSVLEIGAGTLNHLPYEPPQKIVGYDVVEPFESFYIDSPYLNRIRNIYNDITQIQNNHLYDRIISIAVLEHLTELPFVVAYSALLLSEKGLFQHGIPSEGGLAWGLGWRLTTGLSFRIRTGLSYKTLIRHLHVNTATEILAIVRYFFRSIRVKRFPLSAHQLSFYTYLQAENPDRRRCRQFLTEHIRH